MNDNVVYLWFLTMSHVILAGGVCCKARTDHHRLYTEVEIRSMARAIAGMVPRFEMDSRISNLSRIEMISLDFYQSVLSSTLKSKIGVGSIGTPALARYNELGEIVIHTYSR